MNALLELADKFSAAPFPDRAGSSSWRGRAPLDAGDGAPLIPKTLSGGRDIFFAPRAAGLFSLVAGPHGVIGFDSPDLAHVRIEPHFYLPDGLGSVARVVNAAGVVENTQLTTAWGEDLVFAQGLPDRFGFTQRERDQESGEMYYRARMYDPRIGRFGQPDGIEKTDRCYRYVRNNPAIATDPTGMSPLGVPSYSMTTSVATGGPPIASPPGYYHPAIEVGGLRAHSPPQDASVLLRCPIEITWHVPAERTAATLARIETALNAVKAFYGDNLLIIWTRGDDMKPSLRWASVFSRKEDGTPTVNDFETAVSPTRSKPHVLITTGVHLTPEEGDIAGFARLNGRSAFVEDTKVNPTLVLTIAHELGHMFGLEHDTKGKDLLMRRTTSDAKLQLTDESLEQVERNCLVRIGHGGEFHGFGPHK